MTITVKNNSDGTYTVRCGAESVIVGMPRTTAKVLRSFPRLSSSDGGAVAHIINAPGTARGKVVGFNGMLADMRRSATQHAASGQRGAGQPRVLQYHLQGQHSLDIETIRVALGGAGGSSGLKARIFVGGGDV